MVCALCAHERDRDMRVVPCDQCRKPMCLQCICTLLRGDHPQCPYCRRRWDRPQQCAVAPALLRAARALNPDRGLRVQESVILRAMVGVERK